MPEYASIGQRIPRVDAREKVTGTALYSGDISLPGMLCGGVLRSPHPHAHIRHLDITRAEALEGVLAVVTAADVPGHRDETELISPEIPRLAKTKVVFAGQPIAAVAAVNPAVAEEALGLIAVEYAELPPVLDVEEAMKPDTPAILPNIFTKGPGGNTATPSNIAKRMNIERGDIESGFRQADIILENTFRTQRVHQGYIEPMTAVAAVGPDGKVTIWTSSQGIFHAREVTARFLDLPLHQVNVVPVEVGGAFGGKTYHLLAPICALLTSKSGHPVSMGMTREEVLQASRPAPSSLITIKTGLTREGTLTALSATFIFDTGACPEVPGALGGASVGIGPYRIPHLKVEALEVLTNKVPAGSYRAPGAPQGAFAMESQLDLAARALDMDPLEIRMRNAVVGGDLMPEGKAYPRIGFKETLERMAEYLKGKGEPEGDNRGRGISCGLWGGATGHAAAFVKVNGDGSVNLLLGSIDLTGTRTSLSQIVAEELCLPPAKVLVVTGDTDTAPDATHTVGSTITYQMGTAVYQACQDVKAQFVPRAAMRLGTEPDNIEFVQGLYRTRDHPETGVPFADLARESTGMRGEGPVTGRGSVGRRSPAPMFAVHAADVEVDRETGRVKILSYAAAQDVGQAINPTLVEGQIEGSIMQGIGWALSEGYMFDRGIVQNASLRDYKMPTAADTPAMETLLVEIASETGSYGMRPAGEPPMVPCLAAIANAVHSATGVRVTELPITPETLFHALNTSPET